MSKNDSVYTKQTTTRTNLFVQVRNPMDTTFNENLTILAYYIPFTL